RLPLPRPSYNIVIVSSQPVAPEADVEVERLFTELEAKVREYRPKDDLAPLEKAYRFASAHHNRQLRDSAEPYMNHPLLVSHSLRTLRFLSPQRHQRIAKETMEIYAPIAHRRGMGKIRGELEDLSFRYIDPEGYEDVIASLETKKHASIELLNEIRQTVETELRREGIPAKVESRMKRAYSVYQKMKRQKIGVDQVYDLLALRIVTDSVKNCYAALGVIHNEWRPVPGRIKDFIAIPRPNLYQSLHTSVIGPQGQPFEVQIRTEEMH